MNDEDKPGKKALGPLKLTLSDKWLVYSASIGVWLTGALWVYFSYFMRVEGEFGEQYHPLEPLWQKLHGGFGVVATFGVGMLWGMHVVKGWNMRWRRLSGGWLFGITLFLVISGGALYYIESDRWKNWTTIAHWAVGLAVLILFLLHWLSKSLPKKAKK